MDQPDQNSQNPTEQIKSPIVRLSKIVENHDDDDLTSFMSDSDMGTSRMNSHDVVKGSYNSPLIKAGGLTHENSNKLEQS